MDLLDALGAHHLATPLAEAEAVALAEPSQVARDRLMSRGFDQAPVRDRERWVGWVPTAALQPDRKIKSSYRALDTSPIVGASASINDVLPQLAKAGFCFTVGRSGLEGFITPSDLDRHAARVHFYVLISAVETALSQILREVVPQRQLIEWISHVRAGADAPGSPFDSYSTAKSTGTETHVVEYLYLGEMVEFLHQQRREQIPTDLRDKLVMVRNLRPTVMHPTRGLATLGAAHLSAVARAGVSAERELQALAQRLRGHAGALSTARPAAHPGRIEQLRVDLRPAAPDEAM